MSVAFRSLVSVAGDPAARTVNKPSGVVSGDCLVLILSYGQEDTTTTPTLPTTTPPSGFTLAKQQTYAFTNTGTLPKARQTVEVWVKIAGGSEPSSYTVSFDQSAWCQLVMMAYTGTDQSTPVDVTSGATYGPSTTSGTETATGVTVANASSMLLWIHGNYFLPGTNPTGFTTRVVDLDDALDISEKAVNAGATGSVTSTVAGDSFSLNGGDVLLVALQPPTGITVNGGLNGSGGALAAQADVKISTDVALGGSGGALAASTSSGLTVDAALTGSGGALAAAVDIVDKADAALSGSGGALAASVGVVDKADAALTGPGGALAASVASYYLEDEAPGSSIDTSIWTVMNRISDQQNGPELDCCVPAMVTVSGGSIQLTADVHTQSCGDENQAPSSQGYRSGHIQQKTPAFIYSPGGSAVIYIRAKAPGVCGVWPTLFLLGWRYQSRQAATANPAEQNWPVGGWCEIDIAEFWQGARTKVNCTIHWNTAGGLHEMNLPYDATTRYMVYRFTWAQDFAEWAVDAEDGNGFQVLRTVSGAGLVPDVPMYLCMNIAVGGNGGGTVVDASFPVNWDIDYVRIVGQGEIITDATLGSSGAALAADVTTSLPVSAALTGSGAALAGSVDVKVAVDAALAGSGGALAAAVGVVDTVDVALAASGAALAAGITSDNPVTVNLGGSGAVMAASVDVVVGVDAALGGSGAALAALADVTNPASAALGGSGAALAAQVGAVDAVAGALQGSGGRISAVFDGASTVDENDDFFLS